MLTIPHSKSGTKEPENEKKIYALAPYIKGISERLQRAFKSHEVTLIHKPVNSLRSQLVHVKDKTSNLKKCGTVYQVQCEQCNKEYVGETSRLLETRMKEHQSRNSSAIHEHCRLEGHSVDTSKTKVLATEINTFKRRVKEAIEIKLRKPLLNRDNGELLRPILPVYSKNDKRPELSAVAFDILGNIYAADKANHRIQKFTFDGNFLCFIGGLHDLHCPMGIVVKKNGDVIVTEYENHRLKIFSQENLGESKIIGARGVGAGKFACPRGVALDHNDNILVADSQNHRIQVVSSIGEPLGTFGMIGSDPGCLDTPYDVVMDASGNIIVADAKNHRLQVFTRLIPVYAEPAMYDEEYEAAVATVDGEGLEMNKDEIAADNLDDGVQHGINDVVETNETPMKVTIQENNEEEQNRNTGTDKLQVLEESNNTGIANSEESTKQVSKDTQEMEINNN
ncbi:hypothetical protein ACROYT_G018133 [Oculina patagonica]